MKIDKDLYRGILDNLSDGVYFVDRDRRISYWNRGAERITGYKSSEVMGNLCSDDILRHVNADGVNLCQGQCPLSAAMEKGTSQEARVYLKHKDGHRVPVLVKGNPFTDSRGKIVGAVEIFSDVSGNEELVQRLQELRKIALLDHLTGLGNRRLIETGLNSRINELRRYGWKFGLLFIDIDHFKKINDSYGHETGDRVLKMVAGTLIHNARSFDTVGRWGGEEFVAIIMNVKKKELTLIAEKLRALVENSDFSTGKEKIQVTVSIGAALSRPHDSSGALLKRADGLMYKSKLAGRNRVTVESKINRGK